MMWSIIRFIWVCLTALVSQTFIGYQSLLPILENENMFASLCDTDEMDSLPCNKQSLRLDLMYTLSVSASYMSYLFFGMICWRYGPKTCILIGGLLETISCILFSFGNDWQCFFSFIGIGIGSAGMILGLIGIPSQYSQTYQGVLYSLLVGCIDGSSGMTYIFLLLYKHYNIRLQILYISLSMCILITSLISYWFVFSTHFTRNTTRYNTMDVFESAFNLTTKPKESKDTGEYLLNTESDNENSINLYASISSEEMTAVTGIHFNSGWTNTFLSIQFGSILIWSMFYMTTIYFYITTLDKQLKWITDDNDKILFGQELFSIMLLLSGLCAVIIGPVIDIFGMKIALIIMVIISFITCISGNINSYDLEISITMIGFILNRFFYNTMTPLLIVTVFGAAKQQFVYGIVLFLSAVINLFGILFDYVTQDVLNGNYLIFNLVTGISCIFATILLIFVLRTNPLVS
eukprot:320295_1